MQQTRGLLADTHVHLYDCYDPVTAFESAWRNLHALAQRQVMPPITALALCLTERDNASFFRRLRDGRLAVSGFPMTRDGGDGVLTTRAGDYQLSIFAGRQVVTAERLEVLALTLNQSVPDGQPARRVINTVIDSGGIPVLPWSPGKWLWGRGAVVRSLLDEFGPGTLLLGDPAIRPEGWRDPGIMRSAMAAGFRTVAGTDPLPLPGEERRIGQYGTLWETGFDPERPVESVRACLQGGAPGRIGVRLSTVAVADRLFRLQWHAGLGRSR
jgi:hypothetical protein